MKKTLLLSFFIIITFYKGQSQNSNTSVSGIDGYEVFDMVDVLPVFPGGIIAFNEYFAQNMQYPAEAKNNGVQGKVFVQFLVGVDGKIYQAKVIKGIGSGLDEEAIRIVESSPPWSPAKQDGKNAVVRMILPVNFKL